MANNDKKAAAPKAAAPKEKTYTQAELDKALAEQDAALGKVHQEALEAVKAEAATAAESAIEAAKAEAVEAYKAEQEDNQEVDTIESLTAKLDTLKEEAGAKAKAAAKATKAQALKNRPMFTYRDVKYAFKPNAPHSLNIDGVPRPVADLIKEKEVMIDLIEGNSNFVERLN